MSHSSKTKAMFQLLAESLAPEEDHCTMTVHSDLEIALYVDDLCSRHTLTEEDDSLVVDSPRELAFANFLHEVILTNPSFDPADTPAMRDLFDGSVGLLYREAPVHA